MQVRYSVDSVQEIQGLTCGRLAPGLRRLHTVAIYTAGDTKLTLAASWGWFKGLESV